MEKWIGQILYYQIPKSLLFSSDKKCFLLWIDILHSCVGVVCLSKMYELRFCVNVISWMLGKKFTMLAWLQFLITTICVVTVIFFFLLQIFNCHYSKNICHSREGRFSKVLLKIRLYNLCLKYTYFCSFLSYNPINSI